MWTCSEMEVFMAAVRWLMCDWEKRHKHLVEVMSCVRFGLISPWQLVDVRRNPENQEFLLVTRNPDVSCMIEDGLAWVYNFTKTILQIHCSQYVLFLSTLKVNGAPRNVPWLLRSIITPKLYESYRIVIDHTEIIIQKLCTGGFKIKETPLLLELYNTTLDISGYLWLENNFNFVFQTVDVKHVCSYLLFEWKWVIIYP